MKLHMQDNWGDAIEVRHIGGGSIEVLFRGAVTMELTPRKTKDLIALLTVASNEADRGPVVH
jgi:hypothetical protein